MLTRRMIIALSFGACVVLGGCGPSGSDTMDMSKLDQAQAKSAEEATAKANKQRPKPQAKRY